MKFYTNVARKGNFVLCRGYDNGIAFQEKNNYKPSMYVRCIEEKATHRDFYNEPVSKMTFDSMYDMSTFVKSYQDMSDYIWGNTDSVVQFIHDYYLHCKFKSSIIRGAIIDIECMTRQKINNEFVDGGFPVASEAAYPINAIAHYDTVEQKYFLFALYNWDPEKSKFKSIAERTKCYYCQTEGELIREWINKFSSNYPDFISGWNIETFDIPYIVNRVNQVLGETWTKRLSPWGIIDNREIRSQYGTETTYNIVGISTLDYLPLYKKFILTPRESYTLDYISECELNEHKMSFEGTHGSFYWDDPQGFYDYNLRDVDLVLRMNQKLQLFDLVFSIAYFAGINYIDVLSPIKTWDALIYNKSLENGVIVPHRSSIKPKEEYPGAWVFQPKIGLLKQVASFDYTSLYPSANRTWNIGADSIVDHTKRNAILNEICSACLTNGNKELSNIISSYNIELYIQYYIENGLPDYVTTILQKHEVCITPNFQLFYTNKESVFTTLQEELFIGRKTDKKRMQTEDLRAKAIIEELQRRGVNV